jgi:hypothetical protein
MGTLRWCVMCCGMMRQFRIGPEHSMERAMIGRAFVRNRDRSVAITCSPRGHEMQDEPTPEELTRRSRISCATISRRDQRP